MNSLLSNLNLVVGARPIADFTTGVGGAIGGMIGRGIECISDCDKSGNDYGDGTSY